MDTLSAPVAALLGAAIGGGLTMTTSLLTEWLRSRREKATLWLQDRQRAYARFLAVQEESQRQSVSLAIIGGDRRGGMRELVDRTARRVGDLAIESRELLGQIELLGSPEVLQAAQDLVAHVEGMAEAAARDEDQTKAIAAVRTARRRFREVARADLGLDPSGRRTLR